jgi:hypothetical protein
MRSWKQETFRNRAEQTNHATHRKGHPTPHAEWHERTHKKQPNGERTLHRSTTPAQSLDSDSGTRSASKVCIARRYTLSQLKTPGGNLSNTYNNERYPKVCENHREHQPRMPYFLAWANVTHTEGTARQAHQAHAASASHVDCVEYAVQFTGPGWEPEEELEVDGSSSLGAVYFAIKSLAHLGRNIAKRSSMHLSLHLITTRAAASNATRRQVCGKHEKQQTPRQNRTTCTWQR